MPCDQVIYNEVEFKQGTDPELLETALEAAGYTVRVYEGRIFFNRDGFPGYGRFEDGTFRIPEDWNVSEIKRHYGLAAVRKTAAKMGWKVTQKDKNNPFKIQIRRRS